MKKIMTLMLGMSLLFGTVSMFAGDSSTTATKATKTKKAKKTTSTTTTSKM
ncbi:MAG: hypothetical protein ABR905_23205 [Terracidiphilus sp.]|jgi:hypothetical protein